MASCLDAINALVGGKGCFKMDEVVKCNHRNKQEGADLCYECMVKQEFVRIRSQVTTAKEALKRIKSELGVPQPNYPAPVSNAVEIATQALQELEDT